MKKLFAIAMLSLVILASCKKSSSGGPSISAKLNDTSFSFTQAFEGTITNNGKEVRLYVANSTNAVTATEVEIELRSNTALTPGVYSDTAYLYGNPLPTISRYAYIEVYPYIYPSGPIDNDFYTIGLVTNPFTVTVTSISTTSIQGTFRGNLYLDGDSTTTADSIRVITNGRFNAPLIVQN